ncbi:MAG: trimeric intracellular cation channel family protein [Crocinitomicaceae bacterium]
MKTIEFIDVIGTLVFAISGALTAANKRFDLMGVSIIAFVTALGGGTIRDVLIGAQPVGWMQSKWFLIAVLTGVALAYIFYKKLQHLRKTFFIFDAIGLAVFAIGGLEKALSYNIDPVYALMCAMISATMGGLLRDVLCNDVPLIFRKEIYASAALIGAALYLLMTYLQLPNTLNLVSGILVVILVRVLAVQLKVGLPKIKID